VLSDFHFILYLALHHGSWFPMDDMQNGLPALCRAVCVRDGAMASEFMQNPNWLSFCAAIESPGDSAMGSTFNSSEFGTSSARSVSLFGTYPRLLVSMLIPAFDSSIVLMYSMCRPSTSGSGDRSMAYQKEADQMVMMGFDRAKALEILEIAHGNMELAIEMLSAQ
jgi:hypothetical protein